jgi:UDP-N-acetylmuramate dehydrogenase
MEIKKDYDLTKLNTFGVSAKAKLFVELNNELDLKELFGSREFKENKKLFLGGGSNVLFTHDFEGLVILNKIKGIEVVNEDNESILLRVSSGETWHDLVDFAVLRGYWGIENLAFIPGTVGAAPMQNIGAYGGELKNVLESVEVYDLETGEQKQIFGQECELGYRDSVFKNKFKDKYFISKVVLRLSKIPAPNIAYKVLQNFINEHDIKIENPKDISDAVTAIRKSKLPDPTVIGNAGSFFKNIFVDEDKFKELLKKHPTMPSFEEGGIVKIPSAWLIEECGPADGASWKGYRIGNVGVHDKQALVLVNHGGATGEEIYKLALQIIESVKEKFGLELTPEVNLI